MKGLESPHFNPNHFPQTKGDSYTPKLQACGGRGTNYNFHCVPTLIRYLFGHFICCRQTNKEKCLPNFLLIMEIFKLLLFHYGPCILPPPSLPCFLFLFICTRTFHPPFSWNKVLRSIRLSYVGTGDAHNYINLCICMLVGRGIN